MASFRQLLFERIAARGDEAALIALEEKRTLSGTDLIGLVDRARGELARLGIGRGHRVLAVLNNGTAFAILYLACLRAGVVIVPASPNTPPADLRYMTNLATPAAAFVESAGAAIQGVPSHVWTFAGLQNMAAAIGELPVLAEDDIFSVTFTSGSTSRPKAVVHFAERMLGNADAFNRFMSNGPQTRMLHVMPMYYMAGLLNTLLCPWVAGGAVILGPMFTPRSALSFWRNLIDAEVNSFWLSPTMVQTAMQLDRTRDSTDYAKTRLHFAYVGTAAMPPWLFDRFYEKYRVPLLQSYGLSELLLLSADKPENPKKGTVGFLLPEVRGTLADDGELLIETPYEFAGYLQEGNDKLQGAAGIYPTGDLAEIGGDQRVAITGRKKDVIIVGGINVSAGAIEHLLMQHPAVRQAAVKGVADPLYGERAIAFVSLAAGYVREDAVKTLEVYARENLAEAARPARYVIRDELPVGPTGKVQKSELAFEGGA